MKTRNGPESQDGKFEGGRDFTAFGSDSVTTPSALGTLSFTAVPLSPTQYSLGGNALRKGFLNWRLTEKKDENEEKLVKYCSSL